MKVIWLCPYPLGELKGKLNLRKPLVSGTGTWLVNLAEEICLNKDIELHIITHSSAVVNTQLVYQNNIHFHVIRYAFPLTNKGFPNYFRYDILSLYSGFINEASNIIYKLNPDIIHAHGTENAYALTAIKFKIPSIVSIQGIMKDYCKISNSFNDYLQSKLEELSIKKLKNFGCRTDYDKNFINKINKGCSVYYLPEAINKNFFKMNWSNPNNQSLIFVGNIQYRKGIEDLLAAIKLIKRTINTIKLFIIGDGTKKYLEFLSKLVLQLKIENNVGFVGKKNSKDVVNLLSIGKIFVLPSYADNSPNSLAEAMAVGIPSIVTNIGGIPSMITDRFDGILVPPKEPEVLAAEIIKLLNDNELQMFLSKNSRATAYNRNYPSIVAKQTLSVYNEIIGKKYE